MSKIAEYTMVNGVMTLVTRDATDEELATSTVADAPIEPTQLDRIEAQVLYTALMTDTLIEEE